MSHDHTPRGDLASAPLTRRDRRRNRAIAVTALVTVWSLLWGSFTWANLISGLAVAAVVLTVFPLPPVTFAGRLHPLGLLRFALRFLFDLVVSSAQVAALAFRIGHTPRSAAIAVPLRVRSDLNVTLTAEALCLVPGSIVIDVDRATGTLYVHVLGVRTPAEVERFRRSVWQLEARIVAAIGSAAERRLVAAADPTRPQSSADRKGPRA
ncbi:Na+/H+ antiporter subunit E [Nonomuraea sp. NPDC047897]|uniref:Na+/H+ antiporter subunit E n=1 Tax=Nonomuraea sp. NPDC047897 TaxID=3364346 RepID=UPI00371AFEF8